MSGCRGWVCQCPGPFPTAAGGNGRVQPFPRMRISFLPLSRDPEVSTQPRGTWPAERGGGGRLGGGGAETPPTHSPGCSSWQDHPPLSSPHLAGTPCSHTGRRAAARRDEGTGFAGGPGWRLAAVSFSPSPRLRPLPFAQPERATDVFGARRSQAEQAALGQQGPSPRGVAQLGLAELQPPWLQFLGSQPRQEGLEVPSGPAM